MTTEAWIAVLTAFISGGGITALTGYLHVRYKDRQRGQLDERQQVFDQQIGLVTRLETRFEKTDELHAKEIKEIVARLDKCKEDHSECQSAVGFLKGQMHELSKLVMRKADMPLVEFHAAGKTDVPLVQVHPVGEPGAQAFFDPNDSTRLSSEGKAFFDAEEVLKRERKTKGAGDL